MRIQNSMYHKYILRQTNNATYCSYLFIINNDYNIFNIDMDLLRLSIVDCPIIHSTLYLTLTPKITSNNSKYLTLAMYLTLKTVILKK